jgi:hypothetical protein
MKCRFLLLSLIWFLVYTTAQAQAEEEIVASLNNESNKKHIVKTNLLSTLTRAASLSYENVLGNKSSIQAGAYYGKSQMLGGIERVSFTTEYRKYFSSQKNPLVGMYLAPYLKYQQLTDREEGRSDELTAQAEIHTMGGGLLIGRQWIAKKGFTVDMYAGAGYNPHVKLQSLQVFDQSYAYTFSERRWQRDIRLGMVIGLAL